jgi:hypothetical protein
MVIGGVVMVLNLGEEGILMGLEVIVATLPSPLLGLLYLPTQAILYTGFVHKINNVYL